jgi:hypothetical protein
MKKKPHWFRWIDALTFGLIAVLSLVVAIYFHKYSVDGTPKQAIYGTYVTSAAFFAIYIMFVRARKKSLDKFKWFSKYGFMLNPDGWNGDSSGLDDLVKEMIDVWSKVESYKPEEIISKNIIWVHFQPGPITRVRGIKVKPIAGYTIPNGYDMIVGYKEKNVPLKETAFQHELNHLIIGHSTKDWDETKHHEIMKLNNVP